MFHNWWDYNFFVVLCRRMSLLLQHYDQNHRAKLMSENHAVRMVHSWCWSQFCLHVYVTCLCISGSLTSATEVPRCPRQEAAVRWAVHSVHWKARTLAIHQPGYSVDAKHEPPCHYGSCWPLEAGDTHISSPYRGNDRDFAGYVYDPRTSHQGSSGLF
jgi:hypothetical protein